MLSVDGDADAAVETRIRLGWKSSAVGASAYQYGHIIDYERKVVHQLCEQQYVAWK